LSLGLRPPSAASQLTDPMEEDGVDVDGVISILESIGVLYSLPATSLDTQTYRIIDRVTEAVLWLPAGEKYRAIGRRIVRSEIFENNFVACISPALFPAIVFRIRQIDPNVHIFDRALSMNFTRMNIIGLI